MFTSRTFSERKGVLLDGVRVLTGTLRDQIIYPDMIEDMHAKGLNDANLLELISEVRGPGVRATLVALPLCAAVALVFLDCWLLLLLLVFLFIVFAACWHAADGGAWSLRCVAGEAAVPC
jgi:hypothetical protein